jgi:S-formylglutathione hydrolase FrmB
MLRSLRRIALAFPLVAACAGSSSPPPGSPAPAMAVTPTIAAPAAPAPRPAVDGPGTVDTGTLHSPALGVDKRYMIYLPGGYATSGARYPVIYVLHGLNGDERSWLDHVGLAAVADAMRLPAIVVMPDADDSFYVNAAAPVDRAACLAGEPTYGSTPDMTTYCVEQPRYEDYMTRDLIAHIDGTYRTIPERRARAIAGMSMGGFGALMLAMRHRDLYASTASHSGVAALLYSGPHPYERGRAVISDDPRPWIEQSGKLGAHFARIFSADVERWRAHDPAHLARDLANGELAIWLDCGTEDELSLHDGVQYLHEVLEAEGIDHSLVLAPGGHDAAYWRDHLDEGFAFHLSAFERGGAWKPGATAAGPQASRR